MEFWGKKVKGEEQLRVPVGLGNMIHISQAALGKGVRDEGSKLVHLSVTVNGKKFVVGSLSSVNLPHITCDMVIDKDFELSHNWNNGSVHVCGYKLANPHDEEYDVSGKVAPKVEKVKPAAADKGKAVKPESSAKSKVVTVIKAKKEESDRDDDSDGSFDDDQNMHDGDSDGETDDLDDSDSSDSDDSEETLKKPAADKKRSNPSASRTPVPAKKKKVESAQKTGDSVSWFNLLAYGRLCCSGSICKFLIGDGKNGGHVATPYASKKADKASASNSISFEEESDMGDDSDGSFDDDQTMLDADSDDESDDVDDSDSSDSDDSEESLKKPAADKKRSKPSASKTPVPAKKGKVESAHKTDGKNSGHVATPYPSKKAEKASVSRSKQAPKSGARISGGSCPKKFNSDSALQSHTKAKK